MQGFVLRAWHMIKKQDFYLFIMDILIHYVVDLYVSSQVSHANFLVNSPQVCASKQTGSYSHYKLSNLDRS